MLDKTKVDKSICKHGINLEYVRKMSGGYYSLDNCAECTKEAEKENEVWLERLVKRVGERNNGPSGA